MYKHTVRPAFMRMRACVVFFPLCIYSTIPLIHAVPFFKMSHTLNMLLVSPLLFHRRLYAHSKITLVFNISLVVCLLVCFCYNFVFIEVDFFYHGPSIDCRLKTASRGEKRENQFLEHEVMNQGSMYCSELMLIINVERILSQTKSKFRYFFSPLYKKSFEAT